MLGELTKNEIEHILGNQYIGRIACCEENVPYIVPVTYCYDSNSDCIIGHSGSGRKIDILRKNPLVTFEVEDIKDLSNWKTVICTGYFEELAGIDARNSLHIFVERTRALLNMKNHHGTQFLKDLSHASLLKSEKIIYRIKLDTSTGKFERN